MDELPGIFGPPSPLTPERIIELQLAAGAYRPGLEPDSQKALFLGPVAWSVVVHSCYTCPLERASQAAEMAMYEVASVAPSVLGYLQLTKRACEIAEEISVEVLTSTTRSGSVEDSTKDHTEGPEPGK